MTMPTMPGRVVLTCSQRTPEWTRARLGRPTASRFSDFCTPHGVPSKSAARNRYMAELLAERMTGQATDHYVNPAMERGNFYESDALAWYEAATGRDVHSVGLVYMDERRLVACSPDGLCDDRGVEVKVPLRHTQIGYALAGVLPDEYALQVHASMMITGLRKWDFVSYAPEAGIPKLLLTVEADDALMDRLRHTAEEFCATLYDAERKLRAMAGEQPDAPRKWWEDARLTGPNGPGGSHD